MRNSINFLVDAVREFDVDLWRAKRAFNSNKTGFYKSLARTLAKVPMRASLAKAAQLNAGTALGTAYTIILTRYSEGAPLEEVFAGLVSDNEVQVLRAMQAAMKGDKDLAEGFGRLAVTSTGASRTTKAMFKVVSTTVLNGAAFGYAVQMVHAKLFPQFVKMFPLAKWSVFSQGVYALVEFIFHNALISGAALASAIVVYLWSIPNWTGALRIRMDQVALYSWYREYRSTQVLINLAMQLAAGSGASAALKELMRDATRWETSYLSVMEQNYENGVKGGEIFDVGYFSRDIATQLVLLAQSGDTVGAFMQIGIDAQDTLIDEFVSRMNDMQAAVKAFFFAGVALLVMFIFLIIIEYMGTVLNI